MWCLLTHSSAHWLTLCGASVFSTVNTKITNFSISGTSTSKIIYFFYVFWTLPPSFSWRLMELLWARPFKIAQPFFYYIGTIFWMRSWRNAWKSEVKSWMQRTNICIREIVIELYVIKSWWKIKFNKQNKKFINLIFFPLNIVNQYLIT